MMIILEQMESSLLTFNCSLNTPKNLATITAPYQILATPKTKPFEANSQVLIHVYYTTRVFSDDAIEPRSYVRNYLQNYRELAIGIGTKNILIHLPATLNEFKNLGKGIKVMVDELSGFNIHLEIPSWSADLRKTMKNVDEYMEVIERTLMEITNDESLVDSSLKITNDRTSMKKSTDGSLLMKNIDETLMKNISERTSLKTLVDSSSMKDTDEDSSMKITSERTSMKDNDETLMKTLVDSSSVKITSERTSVKNDSDESSLKTLVDSSLMKDNGGFHFVPDTAHLHANGCNTNDMIRIIEKYKHKIQYIHLNGNKQAMFRSDNHVPIFSVENKINNWEFLSEYISKLNKICIAEITKEGCSWKDWEDYAKKYKFELVKRHKAMRHQ